MQNKIITGSQTLFLGKKVGARKVKPRIHNIAIKQKHVILNKSVSPKTDKKNLFVAAILFNSIPKETLFEAQKSFSEIFRRDVSDSECTEMLASYEKILRINDFDEFCNTAFKQIKKDYGYENSDIPFFIDYKKKSDTMGLTDMLNYCKVTINFSAITNNEIKEFGKNLKLKVLQTLIHEFQHIKQAEYACRTDMNAYVNALFEESRVNQFCISYLKNKIEDNDSIAKMAKKHNIKEENIKKKLLNDIDKIKTCGYLEVSTFKNFINSEREKAKTAFEILWGKSQKFEQNSCEYKLGKAYIDNRKNYISHKTNVYLYYSQILEREAFKAEDAANAIFEKLI